VSPVPEFGSAWPDGVQVRAMDAGHAVPVKDRLLVDLVVSGDGPPENNGSESPERAQDLDPRAG
jgi:hypothetical protein